MAKHKIFPSGDNAFNSYIRGVKSYFVLNAVRLLIATGNLTIFNDLMTQWGVTFPLYVSKQTRTTAITKSKNLLRTNIEAILRTIFNDIPPSVLTVDDREALNLPARDLIPTPIILVDYAPGISINKTHHLFHQLKIVDPTKTYTMEMPNGHKAEVQRAVKTDGEAVWMVVKSASRHLLNVNFTDEDFGKLMMYRARYVNTRGEQGNWCDTITALVI